MKTIIWAFSLGLSVVYVIAIWAKPNNITLKSEFFLNEQSRNCNTSIRFVTEIRCSRQEKAIAHDRKTRSDPDGCKQFRHRWKVYVNEENPPYAKTQSRFEKPNDLQKKFCGICRLWIKTTLEAHEKSKKTIRKRRRQKVDSQSSVREKVANLIKQKPSICLKKKTAVRNYLFSQRMMN